MPSSVSAIKVDGRRAYARVRAGEEVVLAAREVTVSRFDVIATRSSAGIRDFDVVVDCSSGTYIRALARDLGALLSVGGHLTALRRTAIGPFGVQDASHLEHISAAALRSPAEVATIVLGGFEVSSDEARDLRHGRRLPGAAARIPGARAAAIDPEGRLVGIVVCRGADLQSEMNMPEERSG